MQHMIHYILARILVGRRSRIPSDLRTWRWIYRRKDLIESLGLTVDMGSFGHPPFLWHFTWNSPLHSVPTTVIENLQLQSKNYLMNIVDDFPTRIDPNSTGATVNEHPETLTSEMRHNLSYRTPVNTLVYDGVLPEIEYYIRYVFRSPSIQLVTPKQFNFSDFYMRFEAVCVD